MEKTYVPIIECDLSNRIPPVLRLKEGKDFFVYTSTEIDYEQVNKNIDEEKKVIIICDTKQEAEIIMNYYRKNNTINKYLYITYKVKDNIYTIVELKENIIRQLESTSLGFSYAPVGVMKPYCLQKGGI